jgi:hypothetical protein
MNKTYELLEKAILDSFIIKPELLSTTTLEEKHFKSHRRLFIFLKECYKRFGTLDIKLMASVCPNASDMIDYIADVIDGNTCSSRFKLYQERLLDLYTNFEIIEEVYKLTKKLYIRDIDLEDYKKELKYILGE